MNREVAAPAHGCKVGTSFSRRASIERPLSSKLDPCASSACGESWASSWGPCRTPHCLAQLDRKRGRKITRSGSQRRFRFERATPRHGPHVTRRVRSRLSKWRDSCSLKFPTIPPSSPHSAYPTTPSTARNTPPSLPHPDPAPPSSRREFPATAYSAPQQASWPA